MRQEGHGDVLNPACRDAREAFLNHGALNARPALAVALNARRGEQHPLEFKHADVHPSLEVVPASVRSAPHSTLLPGVRSQRPASTKSSTTSSSKPMRMSSAVFLTNSYRSVLIL